jgi:hypothetical protein
MERIKLPACGDPDVYDFRIAFYDPCLRMLDHYPPHSANLTKTQLAVVLILIK